MFRKSFQTKINNRNKKTCQSISVFESVFDSVHIISFCETMHALWICSIFLKLDQCYVQVKATTRGLLSYCPLINACNSLRSVRLMVCLFVCLSVRQYVCLFVCWNVLPVFFFGSKRGLDKQWGRIYEQSLGLVCFF